MTTSSRPTVFVSSTIHDFEDLRSSLSYFFERLGYRVQLSEAAEFEKPLLANSYEACFDAIRKADAFLLLIGGRRGGWYDASTKITVTQQEYRVAYEEARTRGLKLVVCVRTKTWAQVGLLKAQDAATWGRSEFIQDPHHLVAFLGEVGRVQEMKDAAIDGERPAANWIHQFGSFAELVAILEIALRLTTDVSSALLRELVADEVAFSASGLLQDPKYGDWLLRNIGPTIQGVNAIPHKLSDIGRQVRVPEAVLGNLVHIALSFPNRVATPLAATQNACTSSAVAELDASSLRVRPSAFQQACRRVLTAFAQVDSFEMALARVVQETANSRGYADWPVSLDLVASIVAGGLHHARALLEAENLVRHVRFGAPLDPNPARHLDVAVLPSLTDGRPLTQPDQSRFDTWVDERTRLGDKRAKEQSY
jgi:hypothetical protein